MSLYQRWVLAFAVVILIAVATIALVVGVQATDQFRRYAAVHGAAAQNLAVRLGNYYATYGSWAEVQSWWQQTWASESPMSGERGGSAGRGSGPMMGPALSFVVADAMGRVVLDSEGTPTGRLSAARLAQASPIETNGEVVGYLLIRANAWAAAASGPEAAFLVSLRWALLLGAAVAFIAALVVGMVLVRGIVAPLRQLSDAAQAIAAGDLMIRAPVRGQDEIAQLAQSFNRMTESLALAETARRAQTADIAHELRNPLAVLQATLEAIGDGVYVASPENLRPALDQVHTLNRLVEDLRLLALADAGQLQLQRRVLDLRVLLERAVRGYRARLEERDVRLQLTLPDVLPQVFADTDRLLQVVNNSLDNAARYLPPGAQVQVRAFASDAEVVVQIVDDGPGIPEAELARLFTRFWRGERSRSRETGGSGLGLSVARRIIEAHGGSITASATPGGGLTLTFTLPVMDSSAAA